MVCGMECIHVCNGLPSGYHSNPMLHHIKPCKPTTPTTGNFTSLFYLSIVPKVQIDSQLPRTFIKMLCTFFSKMRAGDYTYTPPIPTLYKKQLFQTDRIPKNLAGKFTVPWGD